ncbi:MAG: MFS transporter [Pyrobaculum arsenaticum]|uniref:Major facilitator superfamily MFS_1 n=2 Tax=Pyrobaculum arsenaticum TaxID=121277 RepID=A4WIN4_PYRAR|nr:MFS transporter [Pyrobaculum arsenaticum]ABP50251.1 major facilitator superfamily MFS_1 [Pyrobaculum arsenaticum DSM 13514]MCY0889853.1 MFS transporter [Pyrobaculum arsenaticum]NYR14812.1 MFS transporter [Pyrobaculum arsenaticum]
MSLFYIILLSRGVYSLMWFFVAPVLPLVLKEFGVSPAQAGLLPAVFIVGAAVMQLPASYLGARHGHDKIAGLGMVLFGASSVLMGLAPSWGWLLFFRALGGMGAGLFFSTAGAVLIALRPDAVGSALGWYNASFNIGAFVGFYWGYVANILGWRLAFVAPGLASVALGLLLLRGRGYKSPASVNRSTFVYGLASFPFWGAVYAANSLTATWLHLFRGLGEEWAGALSSTAMLSGFLGGFVGRLYDTVNNKLLLLVGAPLVASLVYLIIPLAPLAILPILIFAYGLSFSTYITAVYATSSRTAANPAAALAVINITNMALGLHFSYVFSLLMTSSPAYPWLMLSVLALISAVASYKIYKTKE